MLDATTKRKIDSARQILVGKVPDPKAQVEQITTALVYKFMDDMDKEAEELGGKAKFFTDDFKDFAWSKLLDTRYSGQERMDLYVRAISAFAKAKQLPQLFRDIFKDAFLPYRDPETLSLFLKEIDNFTYDHSEDLGNAFEYLLSVLGSQGDAGQFRTPRHIIDFIVAVVDPKKNETVLDPACGTAGFLISAYKHIRKHNSSNFKPEKEKAEEKLPEGETIAETVLAEKTYRGDQLTPSERGKLMNNFVGYDISPDMVKLSLVNMYLHGFSDPKIYEYDTLTSEKHWGEQFDVIMANPPFMSPNGGIRPHKRFSVQASRSEVLFVDYILEHLNLKGRAGIIVPEGIIFKTENAYKQLRQMLIEDGLFAVVSLPPGVFNPYSGVKTSILLFDNKLAKKSDEILFLKIENDGFDLGAQRRKIDKNDLPEALEVLEAWKQGKKKESNLALWVKKEKIAESGDHNLNGDRYKENDIKKYEKWPTVEIDGVIDLNFGTRITKKDNQGTKYPVYGGGGESFRTDSFNRENELVISRFAMSEQCVRFVSGKFFLLDSGFTYSVKPEKKNKVSKEFIDKIFLSRQKEIYECSRGHAQRNLDVKRFKKITIPLPPLEVQKEIVEQIEVKQNAITHAKEIIKNLERERRYFGQELRKLEDVEWVELGEIFEKVNDQIDPKKETGNIMYVGLENIESDTGRLVGEVETEISTIKSLKNKFSIGDILFGKLRPNLNKVWYADREGICSTDIFVLRKKDKRVLPELYNFVLRGDEFVSQVLNGLKGAQLPRVGFDYLSKIKIPLAPLEIQKQLIAEAEKEEEIIASNRRLIDLMEHKIEEVLSEI